MKNLRRKFERLCYRNRNRGIPNLMLWIGLGTVILYLLSLIDPSGAAVSALAFNREKILHGQIWRLFTWILQPSGSYFFLEIVMLFFYFQIGRVMESRWGVFKFNLYYLCGVLLMDIVGLIFGVSNLTGTELNLSLLLAFATLCPDDRILLFFVIPLRMRYLAWFYFALILAEMIVCVMRYFAAPLYVLFSILYLIVPILNYFLFFGAEVRSILPSRPARPKAARASHTSHSADQTRPNANWASRYQTADGQKPYRHKCTVCGRTDTEYPELEFRYCSRCNGYYCYCIDHINNHAHIQ